MVYNMYKYNKKIMKKQTIDISFRSDINTDGLNLEQRLSNLHPYKFSVDDIEMESWEGFIQSLKTTDILKKTKLWSSFGYLAWKGGQKLPWWEKQEVYWLNLTIDRQSKEYTKLITKSYDDLFEQNEDFRKALKESLPYNLDHSMGKTNKTKTMLTKREYIYQLERLRNKLKPNKLFNLMNLFK